MSYYKYHAEFKFFNPKKEQFEWQHVEKKKIESVVGTIYSQNKPI